ncbi:hypothetical protein ACFYQA_17240 [Streptomyces sp. NPDC005774]|uniref:hypothetical protein n=1 Tax=Streptomyces sp. NPDC005774 TaxID=3364728 RepID=UPI0036D0D54D
MPAIDAAVIWSLAVVAIAGVLALAWRAVRGVRRIAERLDDFVDDWNGVGPRPGVPERPGVMTRLTQIEGRLSSMEHELQPNSGQTLRDAVNRVDRRTRDLANDDNQ